ncbi:hypothetical protein IH981_02920 [Patescibacteria group bacterium]|nr:hypothetical protein [Patescibacteria group bacterium]
MITLLRAIIINIPALAIASPALAQRFDFDPNSNIPFTNLGELIANAAILLFVAAAILAFIFIVIGGVQWIAAGGDKLGAAAARDRITAAVVGLVVVVAAFGITLIVTTLFGINIFGPGGIDFCQFAPANALFDTGAC